jgi:hypothetical protein
VQSGRVERQLVHPIGGLEGYSPAEVRAEQMRARDRDVFVNGEFKVIGAE